MDSRKRSNETSMADLSSELGFYDENGDSEDVLEENEEECIFLERLPREVIFQQFFFSKNQAYFYFSLTYLDFRKP